jgi:PAS domain S-box-containing protein
LRKIDPLESELLQRAIVESKRAQDALIASEKQRRLALDVAELGTWTWDLLTGTGEIDARGARIVGLQPGVVADIAAAQRAVIHPDDLARIETEAARGVASGEIFRLEYRTIHPDGTVHYVDSRALAITDDTGRPIRLNGINRDVTRERTLEAALRASEARQAFLVRLGDALRPLADLTAIKAAAAEALGRHLGVAAAGYIEVEPGGDMGFATGDYSDGRMRGGAGWYRLSDFGPIAEVIRDGLDLYVEDFDLEPRTAGSELDMVRSVGMRSAAAVPLMKGGRLVAFLYAVDGVPRQWSADDRSILREVAERTWTAVERARGAATVRDTEARLQSALDASNMGTFVWYPQEDRTEPDVRLLRLFGLPDDGEITLRVALSTLIHPEDRERYADAVRRAIDPDGSRTLREDIRVTRADGSPRWLAVTARFDLDAEPGGAARLVGMVSDITARKATEQALRESEERLKESDRRKDEFLAMLAHELRNPLAPIRTGLELIRLAGDTVGAVGRVRTIMERQVGHMVRLIDDLLDVSRITSGKIQLQRTPTALADLVNGAVEANRAALSAAQLQLSVHLPEEPCVLDVDPTRVVQVLSNLLHNAVKFTPAGGQIEVSADCTSSADSPDSGFLVLVVSDTGMGISKAMLAQVFDLFTQGEQVAGRAQPGLGIGLALARRLIEMHGGTIEAMSAGRDRGSSFTIRLPLSNRVDTSPAAASSSSLRPIARRVVVIDDNEDAADTMALLVEELGGGTRVAHDGQNGLRAVAEFRPDVVLLDIGMPDMDGYEVCRRIRQEPYGQDMMIIAVTGWGQEQDEQRAIESGFDAHLTKPADPAALGRILAGEALPGDLEQS